MPPTNQISLLSRSRVDWAIEAARRVRKLLLHRSYHPFFSSAATSRGGSSTTVASASGSWDNPCSARDVIFDFFADVSDLNASPSPRSRSLTGGINNNKQQGCAEMQPASCVESHPRAHYSGRLDLASRGQLGLARDEEDRHHHSRQHRRIRVSDRDLSIRLHAVLLVPFDPTCSTGIGSASQ